jgi:hypothetical protein
MGSEDEPLTMFAALNIDQKVCCDVNYLVHLHREERGQDNLPDVETL